MHNCDSFLIDIFKLIRKEYIQDKDVYESIVSNILGFAKDINKVKEKINEYTPPLSFIPFITLKSNPSFSSIYEYCTFSDFDKFRNTLIKRNDWTIFPYINRAECKEKFEETICKKYPYSTINNLYDFYEDLYRCRDIKQYDTKYKNLYGNYYLYLEPSEKIREIENKHNESINYMIYKKECEMEMKLKQEQNKIINKYPEYKMKYLKEIRQLKQKLMNSKKTKFTFNELIFDNYDAIHHLI